MPLTQCRRCGRPLITQTAEEMIVFFSTPFHEYLCSVCRGEMEAARPQEIAKAGDTEHECPRGGEK